LILRKITKLIAIRCHILQRTCNKFDFGYGSAYDPTRGAYSALQTLWLDLKGLLIREGSKNGREDSGRPGREKRENLRPIFFIQNLGDRSH